MYCLDLSREIRFVECEYRKFLPDERHITRKWNKSVMLFLFKNELYFEEDGTSVVVPESTWYIQRDNLLQRGPIGSPAPEYFYVHFEGTYVQQEEPGGTLLPITGEYDIQALKPLLKELYEYQNNVSDGKLYGDIIFKYILLKMKNQYDVTKNGLAYHINKYILGNFDKVITINVMSDSFGYCADYLSRVYKQQYGMTIHQNITHLRIRKAKQLLLSSTKSVQQIGEEVGYSTHSLFYKAFLNTEKMSPQQWRLKNRSKQSGK